MDVGVFESIRRRKLVQWGLAYLAAAWLLVQAFHIVGDQFEWPRYLMRGITALLAFGLSPALVIAWHHGEKGRQETTRGEVVTVLSLVALAAVLAWWVARPSLPVVEFEQVATAVSYSPTRIAVLPFEDFSAAGDQSFLANGIAETLLQAFTQVPELRVIARTSAFAYRGKDIATIARDLEVGTVLEGSVQRDGDRLRVVAQLIRTSDQSHIWSLTFNRTAGDIFAIQDEIAERVVGALLGTAEVGIASRQFSRTSTETYDLYLRARDLWQRREPIPVRTAVTLLQDAIEQDPTYGPAYSELAAAELHLVSLTAGSLVEAAPRIEALIARALELDVADAVAYAVRGRLLFVRWQTEAALRELQAAAALRPSDATIQSWLGDAYDRVFNPSRATQHYARAFELDPMNLFARNRYVNGMISTHVYGQDSSQWRDVVTVARQTVRLFPEHHSSWTTLATTLYWTRMHADTLLSLADGLEHVEYSAPLVRLIAHHFNWLGEFEVADGWWRLYEDMVPGARRGSLWYLTRGDARAMVAEAQAVIRSSGETPGTLHGLGNGLLLAGRHQEARAAFERIAEIVDRSGDDDRSAVPYGNALMARIWLARKHGDLAVMESLSAEYWALIRVLLQRHPQLEGELMLHWHAASGRALEGAEWDKWSAARDLVWALTWFQHLPVFDELRQTEMAKSYLERMRAQRDEQVRILRDSGVQWLFEPERLALGDIGDG